MGGGVRGSRRPSYAAQRYGFRSPSEANIDASPRGDDSTTPRVFISFHHDDEAQARLLAHQGKDPRFVTDFIDYSVKEPYLQSEWKDRVKYKINQSSLVVVMIGEGTHSSAGVKYEVETAKELDKPIRAVIIHKDGTDKLPEYIKENDVKVVKWKTETIQKEIENAASEKKEESSNDQKN